MLAKLCRYVQISLILFLLIYFSSLNAATLVWWDANYLYRYNIDVVTGANTPDKGYVDYTVRIAALDTATLISNGQMQSDCDDLRILFFNGTSYHEIERHVIACNSTATDIRFALANNIPASSSDDNYYLYYGNLTAGAPTALTTTNVYLWYDDASVNRSTSYTHGRIDAWHGTGWDDSLVHNPAGYYTYNTGDNFTSGYRRAVDERDVYIEAEFFHTGCYQLNQTTGVITRGIITSGVGASETSNHYYASNRGQYPGCNTTGYTHDGDVMKNARGNIAVDGPNPTNVVANQWRRQGLASWLINPTNLSFWDEDNATSWSALGYPDSVNLHINGTDAGGADHEGRGFAAFMTAQDIARVRNILVRRYIEPEPILSLTRDLQSDLQITKTDLSAIYSPGGTATYTIIVTNNGPSPVIGAMINDDLPNGVTMTASWTCTPSSTNSVCNTPPSTTDPISIDVDVAVGDTVTVNVPVQFSSDMSDY